MENSLVKKELECVELKAIKSIRENILELNTNLERISEINYILNSLNRSIDFNRFTKEKLDYFEISEILKKANREIEILTSCMYDKTDIIVFDFDEVLKNSEEDKKRLARIVYAFINNGELEKAKKELEKMISAKTDKWDS